MRLYRVIILFGIYYNKSYIVKFLLNTALRSEKDKNTPECSHRREIIRGM